MKYEIITHQIIFMLIFSTNINIIIIVIIIITIISSIVIIIKIGGYMDE